MNRSETIASLAAALCKAQAEVHNPRFDAQNPHFKSKFASLAAVREVVIPALTKHGLSLSQWPVTEASYAGCRSLLAHSSGEFIEETFLIPVDKPNAHGYASAVTYAKRLSMQAIAAVVGDEDDDGNGAIDKPASPTSISGAQVCKDMYSELPQEGKDWVDTIAADVIVMLSRNDVEGAYLHMEAQKFDTEHKGALWSLLDSKQRSAIKKFSEQSRKAA
jgi:ERF superfamily